MASAHRPTERSASMCTSAILQRGWLHLAFLARMLAINPRRRASVDDLLRDPWLSPPPPPTAASLAPLLGDDLSAAAAMVLGAAAGTPPTPAAPTTSNASSRETSGSESASATMFIVPPEATDSGSAPTSSLLPAPVTAGTALTGDQEDDETYRELTPSKRPLQATADEIGEGLWCCDCHAMFFLAFQKFFGPLIRSPLQTRRKVKATRSVQQLLGRWQAMLRLNRVMTMLSFVVTTCLMKLPSMFPSGRHHRIQTWTCSSTRCDRLVVSEELSSHHQRTN